MRLYQRLTVICLGCTLLFAVGTVTTAIDIPMDWLVSHSDSIVVGEVTGEVVSQIEKNFYTNYTIDVEQTLLGPVVPTIEIQLFGGELPGLGGCWYSHRPVIKTGERVILMLRRNSDTPVVGDDQGKFTITEDNRIRENGQDFSGFLDEIQDTIRRVRP